MLICIRADYAKRIQTACSTEATRQYLWGFLVERSDAGGVNIVATDGHVMSVFHDELGAIEGDTEAFGSIIVKLSSDELKACVAKGRDSFPRWLVIDGDREKTRLVVSYGNTAEDALGVANSKSDLPELRTIGKHYIDGSFPDWRRVLPIVEKCHAGLVWPMNPDLIARLGSQVKEAKMGIPLQFYSDGDGSPVLVRSTRDDWFAVAMPMRASTPKTAAFPDWLNAKPAEAPAEAAAA